MAKIKTPGAIQNRHIFSRISFLYQAAACVAQATKPQTPGFRADAASTQADGDIDMGNDGTKSISQQVTKTAGLEGMSRQLLTGLRSVTKKSLIRISPEMKRTICKYCDTLLVERKTCSSIVENKSKGGKKPWADVLVIKCNTCGHEKRFPVSAPRQRRKHLRLSKEQETTKEQETPKKQETLKQQEIPKEQGTTSNQGAPK